MLRLLPNVEGGASKEKKAVGRGFELGAVR